MMMVKMPRKMLVMMMMISTTTTFPFDGNPIPYIQLNGHTFVNSDLTFLLQKGRFSCFATDKNVHVCVCMAFRYSQTQQNVGPKQRRRHSRPTEGGMKAKGEKDMKIKNVRRGIKKQM